MTKFRVVENQNIRRRQNKCAQELNSVLGRVANIV